MPQNVFVSWSEGKSGLDRPKSHRATWPVASSKMFSGFKSLIPGQVNEREVIKSFVAYRYTISYLCKCSSASTNSAM